MSYQSTDDDHDFQPTSPRATRSSGSTTYEAAINLSKLCVGSGILALPFAVDKGGLLLSPFLIACVGFWNGLSCDLMIASKRHMLRNGLITPSEVSSTYSQIAYCAGGWSAVYLTDFCIIVTLLGVCITYLITYMTLLGDIQAMPFETWELACGSILLLVPLCMSSDVSSLSFISLAGLLILMMAIAALALFGLHDYGNVIVDAPFGSLTFFPKSMEDLSTCVGIISFGFGLPSLAFPVEESMKEPSEFWKASRWALIFVWAMYTVVGDGIAVLFEHDPRGISSNVLTNLPIESNIAHFVRILMAIVNLITFPLTFIPPAMMIERVLAGWVRACRTSDCWCSTYDWRSWSLPTLPSIRDLSSTSTIHGRREAYSIIGIRKESQAGGVEDLSSPRLDKMDEEDEAVVVPISLSYVVRAVLVTMCAYSATSIPCFGLIVSLLGSFTVTILSFVIPPYLNLKLITGPAREVDASNTGAFYSYWRDIILVIFGALLCIISSCIVGSQCLGALSEGVC